MSKNEKSAGKILLRTLASILVVAIVLVAAALMIFSVGENIVFAKFYFNADKEFKIPGLWGGSVPQGFEYLDERDTFLYTGYHKDGTSPSMVYVMPDDGEDEARKVELFKADGSNFTSHVGGITVYGEHVYIADGKKIAIFQLSDILNLDGRATQLDSFEVGFGVAFVEVNGDKLYAGNFYRAVDYETPESHHITTPAGDNNTAIIYEYTLNSDTGKPVSKLPEQAYSITDAIQGMTLGSNGEIFLSSSWGLSKSHIYVYDLSLATSENNTFQVDGTPVPITYLDSSCLVKDIVAPPMAEEIVYEDGDIYILTEAASMKYLFGKVTGASWCYAYDYND